MRCPRWSGALLKLLESAYSLGHRRRACHQMRATVGVTTECLLVLKLPSVQNLDQHRRISHRCCTTVSLHDLATTEPGENGRRDKRCQKQEWEREAVVEGQHRQQDTQVSDEYEPDDCAPDGG